jgi:hypothetical protein
VTWAFACAIGDSNPEPLNQCHAVVRDNSNGDSSHPTSLTAETYSGGAGLSSAQISHEPCRFPGHHHREYHGPAAVPYRSRSERQANVKLPS